MKRNIRLFHFALQIAAVIVSLAVSVIHVHAFDADASRWTLKGLTGFYVLIEELNPNIAKYDKVQKNHIGTQKLKSNVENRLRAAGIYPTVRVASASPDTARLWAAALAFPISRHTAMDFVRRLDPHSLKETA